MASQYKHSTSIDINMFYIDASSHFFQSMYNNGQKESRKRIFRLNEQKHMFRPCGFKDKRKGSQPFYADLDENTPLCNTCFFCYKHNKTSL